MTGACSLSPYFNGERGRVRGSRLFDWIEALKQSYRKLAQK